MASFYTTLLGQALFAAGTTVLGGPWLGARVVITDVVIIDGPGDSTFAIVYGTSDSAPTAGYIELPDSHTLHWRGTQVLVDGDTISAATDGSEVSVRVSGWVLLPFT